MLFVSDTHTFGMATKDMDFWQLLAVWRKWKRGRLLSGYCQSVGAGCSTSCSDVSTMVASSCACHLLLSPSTNW